MNNVLHPPNRVDDYSSREENAIREIFFRHWEKMTHKMTGMTNKINQWRQGSIELINKHADQQIKVLNDYYCHQQNQLHESRRANIDTATAYAQYGKTQSDLFDQLYKACSALKFRVAKLVHIKDSIDYITVIAEDHIENKNENSVIKQNNQTDDITNQNINSSQSPTATNSDNIKQVSSTIETFNHDNPKAHSIHDDGLDYKCPVCFMIYPLTMSNHDRSIHVNEHYIEDDY